VSIAYPPDTRTPGFERENRTKPAETRRISAGIEPVSPEQVATKILDGIRRNRFIITADRQTAAIARMADLAGPILRTVMRRRMQA
jgi:3-dehydrosphinganine reductase